MSDEHTDNGGSASQDPATKLRVADIDLEDLAMAMNDSGDYMTWYFDPATGDVIPDPVDVDEEREDPDERGLFAIGSEGSHEAYRDMERFATFVGDRALARRLQRALEGRGAFRRFKDELHSMPGYFLEKWYEYSGLRDQERAIDWLQFQGVVEPDDAEQESAERERLAVAVLDEIEARGGIRIDVAAAPDRWAEIVAAVGSGTPVTLERNGEPFAVITPDD